MAEVYKAKEYGVEGFERTVAVKRILPHVAEDDEFIAMFKDEAKIAVQLNHGNIAQIYNLGNEQDSFYIALEYVNGRDLRAIFQKSQQQNKPMPVAQACYVIMKICEGLDYAHNKKDKYQRELNIVHRDVSPPNILVSFEGEVKLIDFGVAKAAGRASRTQAGILKGKFGYMSPEQVRGMPLDRRSDVFSVGVVLFEVLTSTRLFQAETDFATLEKVRAVDVPRPSSLNPDIPKPLENIIYKALAREPEQRYQSSIELHDELQAFMFAQGLFYSRKDLAAWMRAQYARENRAREGEGQGAGIAAARDVWSQRPTAARARACTRARTRARARPRRCAAGEPAASTAAQDDDDAARRWASAAAAAGAQARPSDHGATAAARIRVGAPGDGRSAGGSGADRRPSLGRDRRGRAPAAEQEGQAQDDGDDHRAAEPAPASRRRGTAARRGEGRQRGAHGAAGRGVAQAAVDAVESPVPAGAPATQAAACRHDELLRRCRRQPAVQRLRLGRRRARDAPVRGR